MPGKFEPVMVPSEVQERWLSPRQVARISNLSYSTLQNARSQRTGIPFVKINGKTIRYKLSDVQKFLSGAPADGPTADGV